MWTCVYVCVFFNKKILTFVAAGVDLYGIVPSERSQTEKNKYCMICIM